MFTFEFSKYFTDHIFKRYLTVYDDIKKNTDVQDSLDR